MMPRPFYEGDLRTFLRDVLITFLMCSPAIIGLVLILAYGGPL